MHTVRGPVPSRRGVSREKPWRWDMELKMHLHCTYRHRTLSYPTNYNICGQTFFTEGHTETFSAVRGRIYTLFASWNKLLFTMYNIYIMMCLATEFTYNMITEWDECNCSQFLKMFFFATDGTSLLVVIRMTAFKLPSTCSSTCLFSDKNKKLSYCWETVRRESMPRIAEMDVEMTT